MNLTEGDKQFLLLTNFSGQPADITLTQGGGTGSTNCNILCTMTGLTASATPCNVATNTYDLSGTISYADPPTSGTLTVTNSCSGATQVFNAPFNATAVTYSITGLPANGSGCTVTAVFSGDPLCTLTQNFTAPVSCAVSCNISAITTIPTSCDITTQQYDVSGNVTFINAPATGSLTISNSCGGIPVVLNAPFLSPAAYSFSTLSANGALCNVTAAFSADAACSYSQTYTAPSPCSLSCVITGITAITTACNSTNQQYDVGGNVNFVNAPNTGSLIITNSCGGSQVIGSAPFTSPASYNFSGLSANGAACTVSAFFSDDTICSFVQSYSSPAPCPLSCFITGMSATPTACNSSNQQYDVFGTVSFLNEPTSGTLTLTNSCGGAPVVLNAPFVSPSSFNFSGLNADGTNCTVAASFSADPACISAQNYTAPAACPVSCSILSLTATPSACDPNNNNYSVSGSVSFVNPPSSGTLTISSSCGGTSQIYNPPFAGTLGFVLTGFSSNGATCNLLAVFSDSVSCTLSQSYVAPPSCSLCPVTALNAGPYCEGQTIVLSASPVPGATYNWVGPNGYTSNLQNPVVTNATSTLSGNYTVHVHVAAPVCDSYDTTFVTINPNPVVGIITTPSCIGVPATLTATGAASYVWSTSETTSDITVPGIVATYSVTGTTNNCSSTFSSAVSTFPPPNVSLLYDTLNGCNPVLIAFSADPTGNIGATYNWNFGDGTTGTGTSPTPHLYTLNGNHTIVLNVSYAANCFSSDSVVIEVYPQPDALFSISPDEIDILTPTAFFNNWSTYSNSWLWNFGDSTSSINQNPSHTFDYTGTFPVNLYSSNTNGGCLDSVTQYVTIDDITTIYIPNAFTPNGDARNDVFKIYSHGVLPENFELTIFDRWGNSIYKTTSIFEGWNGTVNNHGEVVQIDVYVYNVNYKDLKGKKHKVIGHVTVEK